MQLTYNQIHTRLVLANCCLADKAVEVLEAERLGDESRVECKLKEGYMLATAIDRLKCWRPQVEGGSIWKETYIGTITPSATASMQVTFMGYTIFPTRGVPDEDVKGALTEEVNDYSSQDWTIARSFLRLNDAGESEFYVEYDPTIITPTASPFTITLVGGSYTSQGDGAITTDSPWSDRTTNEEAENIFGLIDAICDCPCKKTDQEITDDALPKYVRSES